MRRWVVGLLALFLAPLSPGGIAAATHGPDVVFEGRGWGHGLGLGQWGARGFAEQGWSYPQILTHYYQSTVVAPSSAATSTSQVRIGLTWDQTTIQGSISEGGSIWCSSGFGVHLPAGTFYFGAENVSGTMHGVVRKGDQTVVVRCPGHMQLDYAPGTLNMTGHSYRRGALELSVKPGTSLVRAIALIGAVGASPAIDVYLWGLGEMPSSWPMEALKAQATAARTYALDKIARLGQHRTNPPCDCALVATVGDQAYVGYDKEAGASGDRWVSAVEGSRGMAVFYDGLLIQAYYSSSSGGHTENNELAWGGTAIPYLRGVSDPYDATGGNPHSSWAVKFTWDDLEARFNSEASTRVGRLLGLEIVLPLGVSGRVTIYRGAQGGGVRVVGSDATARVGGDTIRRILGLKSTLFTIKDLPPPDSKTSPAGGYSLEPDGTLVPFGGAPEAEGAPVWPGQDVARAVAIGGPSGLAGYVLSATGNLVPFNGAPAAAGNPGWSWDIARDVEVRDDGSSGYVLDGWGGVHAFGGAPGASSSHWVEGQDHARRLELRSDGSSGYLMTQQGGVYPFGDAPAVTWTALAAGRTAKGLMLLGDDRSGYVIDNTGAFLPFGASGMPPALPSASVSAIGASMRSDGFSGYVVADNGAVKAFGGALNASGMTGTTRKDMAAIPETEGYVLDAWGGLHAFGGAAQVRSTGYWSSWDIARRVVVRRDGAGYVLDGWGGLHPFGTKYTPIPSVPATSAYWPGWDIARDAVLIPPNGSAGYVLDGFGGLHPFGGAPRARTSGYWSGWDIARRVAVNPDGKGGYVLDGWGGLHPFAIGDNPMPPVPGGISGYWPGWDIARDLVLVNNGKGYTVDGWGGMHGFGGAAGRGSWWWSGRDMVVGATTDGYTRGWIVYTDRFGGLHSAPQSAPASGGTAYWLGWNIVRDVGAKPRR